jgi:hypothetical protein
LTALWFQSTAPPVQMVDAKQIQFSTILSTSLVFGGLKIKSENKEKSIEKRIV